jgi:glycyl-tRNA synthetase beta chain
MSETHDLLIEIGTEELPPKELERLAYEFYERVRRALDVHRFIPDANRYDIQQYFYSPRRLAIYFPKLLSIQPEISAQPIAGPALNIAFDEKGSPTKAAEGFARKFKVTVNDLLQNEGKLWFRPAATRREAKIYVPSAVKEALEQLPIPRRMRWGAGEAQFVRPVHWVVMLLGDKLVEGEILGVKSGRRTYGHHYMHPESIELKNASEFVNALRKAQVWLDGAGQDLRQEISRQVRLLADQAGGVALNSEADGALIKEVAALVEWPVALMGSFDSRFLVLPEEVLVTTLEHHQRYFPLRDKHTGKLLPHFVFVSNIESKDPAEVVRGNERVIVPRLTDAMFFWANDSSKKLESRIEGLEHIAFQKDLGSLADKSRRVAKLSALIAPKLSGDTKLAERATRLAKCDLLTGLVGEFPELQGTIGKYLALHDAESTEVADAIEEQYLPRFSGDKLPITDIGQTLALADKLDTVCGIFAVGQKPTGEKDPFGLRRQALGVLRILIERGLNLDVAELIVAAVKQVKPEASEQELAEVFGFFGERLKVYYEEQGIRTDVFAAVVARGWKNPFDLGQRFKAVQNFLEMPEAKNLIAANKRIANILRQAGEQDYQLDPALFETSAEISLQAEVTKLQKDIQPYLAKGDYTSVLRQLAALRAPVDKFFDEVMVMDEDLAVRNNRLALLRRLRALFLHTADLSHIQVE